MPNSSLPHNSKELPTTVFPTLSTTLTRLIAFSQLALVAGRWVPLQLLGCTRVLGALKGSASHPKINQKPRIKDSTHQRPEFNIMLRNLQLAKARVDLFIAPIQQAINKNLRMLHLRL